MELCGRHVAGMPVIYHNYTTPALVPSSIYADLKCAKPGQLHLLERRRKRRRRSFRVDGRQQMAEDEEEEEQEEEEDLGRGVAEVSRAILFPSRFRVRHVRRRH